MPTLEEGLLLCLVVYCIWRFLFKNTDKLGINGKLIWMDKGKETKPFFYHQFKVLGKPDLMYRIPNGVLAVEYKSRNGRIYLSDIIQAKTAALAARGAGYKIIEILIKTEATEKKFQLPSSDKALYDDVKRFVDNARLAKNGIKLAATPSTYKCRGCAYRLSCSHAT